MTSRSAPPRRPAALVLVFVGGSLGTAARHGLSLALPATGGIPWLIGAINLVGAFCLGLLLESLTRRGPELGLRRSLRPLLGTGLLGGFTTYSALAADTALLIGEGRPGAGIGYSLATLLIGAIATWAGIAVATLTHPDPGHDPRAERGAG